MSTQPRTPRASSSGSVPGQSRKFSIGDITKTAKPTPNRYGLYAGGGFGKTSLAAYSASPIFIETRGETGLETLISANQLPEVPHFPEVQSWTELLSAIQSLREEDHTFKTLVLDTMNGAERLCHEFVAKTQFSDDWTDKGFMGYMRGYEVALADWRMFLNSLDELRIERNMTIFTLFHSKIQQFKNPSGADWDRYVPEMHPKTWNLTRGWLDCILFGNFEVLVKQGSKAVDTSKKGKASDTSSRVIYTNSDNPTYDAKNRLGLPDVLEMGASAKEGWANFMAAIKAGRELKKEGE